MHQVREVGGLAKCWVYGALLCLTVAASATFGTQASEAEVQLQAALHVELADGELNDAIELYKGVIDTYANQRAVAAKALLQIGRCLEKLGDGQARDVYARVLGDYPDQAESVAAASARLLALGSATAAPPQERSRLIVEGDGGTPSPDGRYLTSTDNGTGDLKLRDLFTGQTRFLTHARGFETGQGWAFLSRTAPDSSQVAYSWETAEGIWDLRVIDIDGTDERVLLHPEEGEYIGLDDWTADSRQILATISRADQKTVDIVLVSAADGSVETVASLEWENPWRMRISPDGSQIALSSSPGRLPSDIYLLDAGGALVSVVADPANDTLVGWTPDGSSILFSSARDGSKGLWTQRIEQGAAVGAPELIKPDFAGNPRGLTRDGALFYSVGYRTSERYLADVDIVTGELLSEPVLTESLGLHPMSAWSPDGNQIVSGRQVAGGLEGHGEVELLIRSMKDGSMRSMYPGLAEFSAGSPVWSPNGQFVVIHGRDHEGHFGLFEVDVATGGSRLLVEKDPEVERFLNPQVSADSSTVYYQRFDDTQDLGQILALHRATGDTTVLYEGLWTAWLKISPQGDFLGFVERLDPPHESAGLWRLMVMPIAGGPPRELLNVALLVGGFSWMPDGRSLLLMSRGVGDVDPDEIRDADYRWWRVSVESGAFGGWTPPVNGMSVLNLRADGQQMIYSVTGDPPRPDLWVLENFLR